MKRLSKPAARRLEAADKAAILQHLLTLTQEDRHSRFASTLSDIAIANYVEKIDFERDIGLGIVDSESVLAAFIHLSRHCHDAELGASVRLAARHQGYARALFKVALGEAERLGIRRVQLATGHPAALHIAWGLGYRLESSPTMPRASILIPALKYRLERLPRA